MSTDIENIINSGLLEAYISGAATPAEEREVEFLRKKHHEVRFALNRLEIDIENMASAMAIEPPPGVWDKIEQEIDGLILREKADADFFKQPEPQSRQTRPDNGPLYIEVETHNEFMRIHKSWKWVFAAVFVLGKIFLGCAIFFYLENRQAQQQLQQLKSEINLLKK